MGPATGSQGGGWCARAAALIHYTQSRFKRILLWGLRLRRSRFKGKEY